VSNATSIYNDEWFNEIWTKDEFDAVSQNTWLALTKHDMMLGSESRVPDLCNPRNVRSSACERKSSQIKALHSSIRDARLAVMKMLIDVGADVNYNSSVSLLHMAAFRKDSRYVELLLARGVDPNVYDNRGQTALHQAIRNSFIDNIIALLNTSADPNARYLAGTESMVQRSEDKWSLNSITPII
jgi:ankyrin repeat protein